MVDPKGDAGDPRGAGEDAGDARRLDSQDPGRAGARRLPPDRVHAPQPGAVGRALVARRAAANHEGYVAGYFIESAINHYTMTNRAGHQAVRRGQEAGRLLVRQHRPCAEAGVVRRPPGDGAGAGPVRPVRQRGGGRRQGATATSRWPSSCSTRRKGGTEYDQSHLPVVQQYEAVGHAVRAVYTYSGMADVAVETRDVDYQSAVGLDLGQHRQPEVLRHGRSRQRRDLGGVRPRLLAAQQRLLRVVLELRRDLLPVEAEPGLRRRQVRRPLRGDASTTPFSARSTSRARNFYYDNPLDANVPRYPWHNCPCCVGNIPRTLLMLPTWMYAQGAGQHLRQPVRREHGDGGQHRRDRRARWCRRRTIRGTGRCRITVNPKASKRFSLRIRVPNREVSELYTRTPEVNGHHSRSRSTARGQAGHGEGLRGRSPATGRRATSSTSSCRSACSGCRGSEKIEATRGRVALQYGPLVYNIEKVDQDITKALPAGAPLATEWKPDLLGGVTVIKGAFADGSPMMAIPNYARYNRNPPVVEAPRPVTPPAAAQVGAGQAAATPPARPPRPPATSVVWMKEG